nr:MAG TPA: hypothetical protein [Caudoviricetes sp.]
MITMQKLGERGKRLLTFPIPGQPARRGSSPLLQKGVQIVLPEPGLFWGFLGYPIQRPVLL